DWGTQVTSFAFITAPALVAAPDQSAVEGATPLVNLGSFFDTGAGPWIATINWGDGTPNTTLTLTTPSTIAAQAHTFGDEGSTVVIVTVTNASTMLSSSRSSRVAVSDPSIVATGGLAFTAVEGALSSLQAV